MPVVTLQQQQLARAKGCCHPLDELQLACVLWHADAALSSFAEKPVKARAIARPVQRCCVSRQLK